MFKHTYKHILIYMFLLNILLCGFNNCFASINFKNNIILNSKGLYLITFNEEVLDYKLSNPSMIKLEKPTAIFNDNNTYLIKPMFNQVKSMLFIKTKTDNLVFNIETKASDEALVKNTENYTITKIDKPPKK